MIYLVLFVGAALGISALCSLIEATFLSIRIPFLVERKDGGSRGAALLLDLKQERIDDAITAILTINTAANCFGATMAGAQAEKIWGANAGLFAIFTTLLILVFAEIIPKTIGANYAARIYGFVGYTLHFFTRAMGPVLAMSRLLTRVIARGEPPPMSREELAAVIAQAETEGAIAGHEERLFSNLLRFQEIRIHDVMTPRTVAEMLPAKTSIREYLENRRALVFSRIPNYEQNFDNVTGYFFQRDVLMDVVRGVDRARPISRYLRKVWFIPELASISDALRQFIARREPLAIALDEHGGVSGLVTFEDIIETILGVEIVHESDRVADLRRVAAELRERRLERIRASEA